MRHSYAIITVIHHTQLTASFKSIIQTSLHCQWQIHTSRPLCSIHMSTVSVVRWWPIMVISLPHWPST